MRHFVIRIGKFCCGFLFLFALLSTYNHFRVDTVKTYAHQFALFHAKENPKVLILGDSRPTFGIQLPKDSLYFNFANPGENWEDFLAKATVALKEKPSIKLIIITADNYTLGTKRSHDSHESDMLHLADSSVLDPIYHKDLHSFSWTEKIQAQLLYYFPLFGSENRHTLVKILTQDVHFLLTGEKELGTFAYDENGNVVQNEFKVWSDFSVGDRVWASNNFVDLHYSDNIMTPVLTEAANRFFDLANEKNVAVVGIRFPIPLETQERIKKYPAEKVDDFFRSKPFLSLYDYEHLFDDHQDYFMDESHLNAKGAHIFTSILLQYVDHISGLFHSAE